ncbi:MAG: Rieske 2Fe-2S domain-containing protein [Euryarchaeota archaeon]|nr:Rieske 2Fe-2S domain-containing protein [Euryarchaeota archaeon]MDE1837247.1 Rieske 2Fe-2S domain-containing protein [Euryarchaeota archaeon]MDE1881618.1 Rieske 2Fe-2S domain-containing protein [Euryarchaeota archaeon]MDE2045149.1 Rieske 2Fe-2S domain-containing protein [Thermoplasmata archaeon]
MAWVRTGVARSEVPPGGMREIDLNGHLILLIHHMDQVYATAAKCTHAQGDLAQGKLQGNRLTCPRHGSVFDVKSGIVLQGPYGAMKTRELQVYHTRVEDGQIEVELS